MKEVKNCQHFQRFSDYLKNKTVAIVGPATTLHMSQKGDFIDTFDVICRLGQHMVDTQEMAKDCGSRNDICFSGPNLLYVQKDILNRTSPKFICFPRKNIREPEFYEDLINQIYQINNKIDSFHIGNSFSSSVEQEMGTSPNTGILAVAFLLTLPIKHLFVCGFDFYQNKTRYYQRNNENKKINGEYDKQIQKYGFVKWQEEHDQEKHMEYFRSLMKKDDRIEVDDYLKKILKNFITISSKQKI